MSTHSLKLNIHFYNRNEVAFEIENNMPNGDPELLAEIHSFCLLAMRQLNSLNDSDTTDIVGAALAKAYLSINAYIEMFYNDRAMPRIINYPGHPGRKLFLTDLTYIDDVPRYSISPKGFGLLCFGMNFYASASIVCALAFLAQQRIDNPFYMKGIANIAQSVMLAYHRSQVNMQNHMELAAMFTANAFPLRD